VNEWYTIPKTIFFVPMTDKQATMTGRSWRHFCVFWPFMVAGLIGPPDYADPAPTSSFNSRSAGSTHPSVLAGSGTHPDDTLNDDGWVCVADDDLAVEHEPLGEMPNPDVVTSSRYLAVFENKPVHDAIQEMFCKAAELGGLFFGDNVADSTTVTERDVRAIEADAETLGVDFLQTLYGRTNTTKVHRLIYHLADELRARGNLWEGDTSLNETLHGACKRMYKRTNKRGPGGSLQMMRCEQTQVEVLREIGDVDGVEAAAPEGTDVTLAAPTRTADLLVSGRGKRVVVGDLLATPELEKFAELFVTDDVRWVTVCKKARIVAQFEWGAVGHIQFVQATPSFMGKAWYSFVKYKSSTGEVRWGRARLVVRSFERRASSSVVVQRLHRVDASSGCVLTAYGCVRLAWDFESVGDSFPALDIVDTTRILRLEDVQVDWRDFSDRHGLRATPYTVTSTPIEQRAARFFTNPFYPWTSRDLMPALR